MNDDNKYIRFDWAAKRMLRDKANFGILEGLLTVLFNDETKIIEILESESNQESCDDKFNRVDIKCSNSKGEIILVEIQQSRQIDYLQRVLYAVSKTISEHIKTGEKYGTIKKVYSISIVYFDLGEGTDYLYHGQTVFEGVHTHDTLKVNAIEDGMVRDRVDAGRIFPEYYLIRVNEFNKEAATPFEEWMEFIKNGRISPDTQTPGLQEAAEKLQYMKMTDAERHAYDRHVDYIRSERSIIDSALYDGEVIGLKKGEAIGLEKGLKKGEAIGLEKGRAEGILTAARNLKALGMPTATIVQATGLSAEEIEKL